MDLKNYAKLDENGKIVYDLEAFNAELDRERNKASETATSNTEKKLRTTLEKELREKIANEEKMTAEEKVKAERELLAQERLAFNKERVKNVYTSSNLFKDEEIAIFEKFITDDYEASLKIANDMVNSRKTYHENYEREFLAKMQSEEPRNNGGSGGKKETEAQMYARKHSEQNKVDIVEL